jgi:FSR family fosmidomycin resistance protein-like MFS transporter
VPVAALVATIAVMASRSWTTTSLENFTPTWYHQLGYQPWFYGPLATSVVLASALGTVGTASLSEKWGRRTVIIASLFLSLPAVALYVLFPGAQAFVFGFLVGALAASTAPLTLMLAQELMAARAGFASGLIMGLGFITSAIGTPITGFLGDRLGLQAALGVQLLVIALTIPIAWLLPSESFLARHRDERFEAAGVPVTAREALTRAGP